MTMIKTYTNLIRFDTFEDRFEYLKLGGNVGRETFGFDRHVNQAFYRSRQWQAVREYVIVRDYGCDLGVEGYEIPAEPLVHHMNPMAISDIIDGEEWILNPEFLITTSHDTHNAIHYGSEIRYPKVVPQRSPNDTKLW